MASGFFQLKENPFFPTGKKQASLKQESRSDQPVTRFAED
jgi:hypothetical protein